MTGIAGGESAEGFLAAPKSPATLNVIAGENALVTLAVGNAVDGGKG